MAGPSLSWLERLLSQVAPRYALRRLQSRMALDTIRRYYDAAGGGRRTEGWRRVSGDGNAAAERGRGLRDTARDLVRNNPWAKSAVSTIVDHVIGWGIEPALPAQGQFGQVWKQWAGTPLCDAERRRNLNGLARQVLETVVTSGECLVRRRVRDVEDGLPIPLNLQVLEPDHLDETKEGPLPNGGHIVQGVEYSPIGEVVAYWLFRIHPGAQGRLGPASQFGTSSRVPAEEIAHIGDLSRPGQSRGVSWFAPVMLRLKDLDDYEDAALMKQKVAACLSVLFTDATGDGAGLGTTDDTVTPALDRLQPGLIARIPAGNTATVVDPPSVGEHGPYTETVLRGIATGLGISYEDLTGDYTNMPFSAARMSRIRHYSRVHCWQWDLMIPQFYNKVWQWAVQLAPLGPAAQRAVVPAGYLPEWTPPPMPMLDPTQEGQAYQRNIRSGLMSLSEAHRELGYSRDAVLKEMSEDWQAIDRLGLIIDSDPRKTTQAGQLQGDALPEEPAPVASPATDESANRASVERLERMVDRLVIQNGNGHKPAELTIAEGAIQLHAPVTVAPPEVNVAPAQVTIEPPAITFEPGSIRGGDVTVTPPPQAEISVIRMPKRGRRAKKAQDDETQPA